MDIFQKADLYQSVLNEKRLFEGNLLRQIKDYYRIGLTWTSNALEGNRLTESETKVLIEDGLIAGGKPLRDSYEAIGHAKAYDYMFSLLRNDRITEGDIKTLHEFFYQDISSNDAGIYRTETIFITGSSYPVTDPKNIQVEMIKLVEWANTSRKNYHPIEFAAKLHERFVFIHPFIDGNGRVARLLMNTVLIQDGYMLSVIPPVLRTEYISFLEKAHKDDKPFINFVAERVIETQKDMMQFMHISIPKQDVPER